MSGFLSARLEWNALSDFLTARPISPMAMRSDFRTVNDVSASTSQSVAQHHGGRFQPLISLKRYPMIFWGIAWICIALPSAFAIASLTNPNAVPDAVEPNTVTAIAPPTDIETAKPLPDSSTDPGQLPLWVFGAIAIGCTASCFMLARYMKPIEIQTAEADLNEPIAPSQTTLAQRSRHPINSVKQPLKRLKPYESTEALPFLQVERSQPIQPQPVEWVASTQPFDAPYFINEAEPVLATIILAEEIQPLDWGEARLADAMDLRRRYPLHFAANNNSQS